MTGAEAGSAPPHHDDARAHGPVDRAARPAGGVLDQFRLDGRAAVVTGGAQGLGRAITLALVEAGASAVVLDRLEQDAPEVSALQADVALRGSALRYRRVDLGGLDAALAAELVAWAWDGPDSVDVLVNNAGTISRGPATGTTEDDWRRVLDLDLTVPFLLTQAFARPLLEHDRPGNVINLGSINSFQGGFEVAGYAAAKHGLVGLTKALANEWYAKGVTVNALAPGYMDTHFTQAHRDDPERYAAMTARIPAARWGRPADLSGAAVFLASRASAYVTGTTLAVDGGWLGR